MSWSWESESEIRKGRSRKLLEARLRSWGGNILPATPQPWLKVLGPVSKTLGSVLHRRGLEGMFP